MEAVDAPRRGAVDPWYPVEIDDADAACSGHAVDHLVELCDSTAQRFAKRCGQPEDPGVVMESDGEHATADDRESRDDRVEVGMHRRGAVVRAQCVVHSGNHDGQVGLRHERDGQLRDSYAAHPSTRRGDVVKPVYFQRGRQQWPHAAPTATGQGVTNADGRRVSENDKVPEAARIHRVMVCELTDTSAWGR